MNQIDKGYLFFGLPYNNLRVSVHLGPWVYFRSQEGAKPHSRLKNNFSMQNGTVCHRRVPAGPPKALLRDPKWLKMIKKNKIQNLNRMADFTYNSHSRII